MKRLVLCVLLVGACGAEEPVPAKPTYVDDVEPILRANCFHCHGAGERVEGASRFDVYDRAADRWGALTDSDSDAKTKVALCLLTFCKADASDDIRMPPPPATRLSPRDLEVLKRWTMTMTTQGKRTPNAKPTATWLVKNRTFVVRDGDHEQVIGEIDCGGRKAPIPRSGTHVPPGPAPCTGTLFDGQDEVPFSLMP